MKISNPNPIRMWPNVVIISVYYVPGKPTQICGFVLFHFSSTYIAPAAVLPPSVPASFLPRPYYIIRSAWLGWLAGHPHDLNRIESYRTEPGGRPRCVPINNASVKLIKLLNIYVQTIRDYVPWFHRTQGVGGRLLLCLSLCVIKVSESLYWQKLQLERGVVVTPGCGGCA